MKQLFIRFACACQSLFALANATESLRVAPSLARPDATQMARVLIVQDAEAIRTFQTKADVIQSMVNRAITNFTGTTQVSAAWLSLVSTQDTVGLKVYSAPGAISGTRPDVVAAVVQGLLQAGLPPKRIIVWDQHAVDLRLAGFFDLAERFGVRVAGSSSAGYDEKESYDVALLGHLIWGDLEFGIKGEGIGRKSFVSKLVTQEMTKIINITPLLNHNYAGVSGNLYGLAMGSVDNTVRFEQTGDRLVTAVPEIYALRVLGDRVALNIVDALICQYEGGQRGLLHYSSTLNELRFSKDPVALDVLSVQELERLRGGGKTAASTNAFELYQNAALLEIGINDPHRIRVDRIP